MKREHMQEEIMLCLSSWTYKMARRLKSCLYHTAMQAPLDKWPELTEEVVEQYAHGCILDLDRNDRSLSREEEEDLHVAMVAAGLGNTKRIHRIFESYRRELHRA